MLFFTSSCGFAPLALTFFGVRRLDAALPSVFQEAGALAPAQELFYN